MAVEIPNILEAAGCFAPVLFDPWPAKHILSSAGIQPFNPAATPEDTGGFFRFGAGDYFLGLQEAIDPLEAITLLQIPEGGLSGGAFILPNIPEQQLVVPQLDGKHVAVEFVNPAGVETDPAPLFYAAVLRYTTGSNLIGEGGAP
jgi:hypothetical protein